jgi:hypothetical protein
VSRETPQREVFISYSPRDAEFARRLASDLRQAGLDVFYDMAIKPGDSWAEALTSAIEQADFFLVVLSPDYMTSEWARQELAVALASESAQSSHVIPLLVRPTAPRGVLATKTYADFTSSYEEGLHRLLPVLLEEEREGELGPSVGEPVTEAAAADLERLREELRDAVELFKSGPAEQPASTEPEPDSKRRCFVVMPFGEQDLEVVYDDYIKPVIEERCGLACERGDDLFGSNVIMDDILSAIQRADLVLADLTRKNANVFYEVGICHALDKPVLLLAQTIDDVPFDLRHRRVLLYEYSARGCKQLEFALPENVSAVIGAS